MNVKSEGCQPKMIDTVYDGVTQCMGSDDCIPKGMKQVLTHQCQGNACCKHATHLK